MALFRQLLTARQSVIIDDIETLQSQISSKEDDITALQGRLDSEVAKINALQSLTTSHTSQLNTNNDTLALNLKIETEKIKTVALQSLTESHTSQITTHDGDITALQGRLDIEEQNIVDLETLTESHTTQINLNDGDILALQGRLDTLDNTIYEKSREFNTIVIRRFNNTTSTVINLNELQVWVNDTNIMVEPTNNLNGYFANRSSKNVALEPLFYSGVSRSVGSMYNNIISTTLEAHSDGNANSTTNAIIIKNISSTFISDIHSIVLYY